MFCIDLQSRSPIYEQIYNQIKEQIVKGELELNEQLPSVRVLAKELGVNPNTISKAYLLLEKDKYIYLVSGKGSFVAKPDAQIIKEQYMNDFCLSVKAALKVGITPNELVTCIEALKEEQND